MIGSSLYVAALTGLCYAVLVVVSNNFVVKQPTDTKLVLRDSLFCMVAAYISLYFTQVSSVPQPTQAFTGAPTF
jgi:hypothetical protein